MFEQGAEQTPIPCRNCGATMKEHGQQAGLVGPVQVVCPYCRATETLPHDQAQRVHMMRARLAQLRAAQEAEEAPALGFARTMQMVRKQWMFGGLILLFAFGSMGVGGIKMVVEAIREPDFDDVTRNTMLLAGTASPAFGIGLFVGAIVGYAFALRAYRRAIEPAFRAKAPEHPGFPARCRACGGPLPVGPLTGAFVPCRYCNANNLITKELARDRSRFLEEEARGYHERAAGVQKRAQATIPNFTNYFLIGGGVGVALALVMVVAVQIVIRVVFL